jgi:TldD protein
MTGLSPEEAMRGALHRLSKERDVRYAEVRFVDGTIERIGLRDLRPEVVTTSRTRGVGIRVLGEKTWGFACTAILTEAELIATALRSLGIARASSRLSPAAVPFPEQAASRGTYRTSLERDPFTVPLEAKLASLEAPVRALSGAPIRSAEAHMKWTRLHKRLITSEGTDIDQTLVYGAAGMHAVAVDDSGETQRRSFPTWRGFDGFQGGYEHFEALDLVGHAPRVRAEAIALLSAPPCPDGPRALLLESSQMALQIHESCGHPAELDRALGTEITLAGGSFMQPSLLGTLRYGSELVNLYADARTPGGMGTFGWDDEGVAAGKHALVERGRFVDYLSSRETAARIGRASTGTMRAESWDRTPLIRMVNVNLEPGQGSLEDLVADTADGVLMATDVSWSIDDLRHDFQFSCEAAWEIRHGKRTRLLRRPFYTGRTPQFWASCDAICGPEEFHVWGADNCGKGDPMQMMQVGHGAAPARFRDVTIGHASRGAAT